MSREHAFLDRLRAIADHPAARGLMDDAAVLPLGNRDLVLTHDMLVEGVHYLPADPPADVAWKLVAANLSDLAAKGARPIGALMGYMLARDAGWDAAFADGLEQAVRRLGLPLFGGDTVAGGEGPRAFGLTAIGEVAPGAAPSRTGARAGDELWLTGAIGAAGLGLALARSGASEPRALLDAYRRPQPRLAEGRALAPQVRAMADVSDGLLLDAARIAHASNVAVSIALDAIPIAPGVADTRAGRIAAATAGDDYELLFATPPGFVPPATIACTRIGGFASGRGLALTDRGTAVPPPPRLGYEHD